MNIDPEILQMFCDEASDSLIRWEKICLEQKRDTSCYESMLELFRIAHNLKGGSKAVGLLSYGDFIHRVEDGITLLRDGKLQLNAESFDLILEAHKILTEWLCLLRAQPYEAWDTKDFLKRFEKCFFGQPQTATVSAEPPPQNLAQGPADQTPPSTPHPVKSISPTKPNTNANETIRISAQKLDQLIQSIGELSIHQSILWHTKSEGVTSSKVFSNSLQLSQKLTKELYDRALSLRMQPLQSVFQRLERNILDLSKSLSKDVQVQLIGSEVELDKMVIERIVDPLMHIVRNAIDHGIESKENREAKGKSGTGLISISAHKDSFGVVVTVQDDGKGLAADRILKKAIEKGLIDPNETLSEDRTFQLIFLPGFSTAELVTEVSGRGVGMDVVRQTLEQLSGKIRIESAKDQGTKFVIMLPTSVSIIDAMIVGLCSQTYVIPVSAVEEVIDVRQINYQMGQTMVQLRDQVVPVHDLNEYLQHRKSESSGERHSLLICRSGNKKIGFLIEKIIGQQQIVVRQLSDNIAGAFGFLGGTILGNGEPGLIIDIPHLVEHYLKTHHPKEHVA